MKFAKAFPKFLAALLLLCLPTAVHAQFTYATNNGAIAITDFDCSESVVDIPASLGGLPVTSIGDLVFAGCLNLTSVTIPSSITSIGESAFQQTSLTSVTIPNSVTNLGDYIFDSCTSLTNVTIPNGINAIAVGAFKDCTSLTSFTIPTNVTEIGDVAFEYCTGLIGVYFQSNAPSLGSDVFSGDTNAIAYYFPKTTGWGTTFGGLPTMELFYTFITTNGSITD